MQKNLSHSDRGSFANQQLAARSGFEPESTAPKAVVLPLHYRAIALFIVAGRRFAARGELLLIGFNDARLQILTKILGDRMGDVPVVQLGIRSFLLQVLFPHQGKSGTAFVAITALDLVLETALGARKTQLSRRHSDEDMPLAFNDLDVTDHKGIVERDRDIGLQFPVGSFLREYPDLRDLH